YYKPGSAKALNCVKGHGLLIDFCKTYGVPYELCGKVIIANHENQLPVLDGIFNRGIENGLSGIAKLEPQDVHDIEPHCNAIKGIWVPQAGIIDYRQVANMFATLILGKGGN